MKRLTACFAFLSLTLPLIHAGEFEAATIPDIIPEAQHKPFAITAFHLYQEADLAVAGLDFAFLDPSPDFIPLIPLLGENPVTHVEDTVNVTSALFSWDPVPWFQVFGRIGNVEGESSAVLVEPFEPVTYSYDGYTYAAGATLRWANDRYFAFLNTQLIETQLDGGGSANVWALDPRVGIFLSDRARAFVGASRQESEQTQTGSFDSPVFGPTEFTIDLVDIVHWNYVVGFQYQIGDVALTLEGGFGHRKHVAAFASIAF